MTLRQFLRKRLFTQTPVVSLPPGDELHQAVVHKMRMWIDILPDGFHPDDHLPAGTDYPTPFEERVEKIARYNLRMLILAWRVLHEEAQDELAH